MDIAAASTFFDDDPVSDGYTGTLLFYGQSASFDDSSSDGATNRRRVLSVGPDVIMPARRVLSLYGDRWLVGTGTPDGFQGEKVRQHFTMKRATDLAAVLTPGEALAAAAGTSAYVHKHYFKESVHTQTNADIDTFWNVFIAPGESADRGTIIRLADDTLLRARNAYLPVEGLRVLQCDQLEDGCLTTATFDTGTFDPITETRTAGGATVAALQLEPAKFFRYRHLSDPQTVKGDLIVFVPTSLTPKAGGLFTMGSATWRVVTVQADLDVWAIHARRA